MRKLFLCSVAVILMVSSCVTKKEESKRITMQPEEIVTVTRHESGSYSFKFEKEIKHTVAYGEDENSIDWKSNTDGKMELNSFSFACPFPQQRYVFGVKNTENNELFYVSEKHIPMQGTPNFRDLGGIVNKDGRQVRWGKMFRSGALANLTPQDLAYFKTLNIGKVIDFRTPDEIERGPDRYPDSTVIGRHAMIGNPANISAAVSGNSLANITAEKADTFMIMAYENFINSLSDFQPIFDAMLNDGPDKPFLFHCTAGKDRTGISGALILTALNVDREVIFNDYLLSNKYLVPFYESSKESMAKYGFTDEVIKIMSSVKREYLQKLFEAIDEKYGDDAVMLEQVFGITLAKREQLIKKYTI